MRFCDVFYNFGGDALPAVDIHGLQLGLWLVYEKKFG